MQAIKLEIIQHKKKKKGRTKRIQLQQTNKRTPPPPKKIKKIRKNPTNYKQTTTNKYRIVGYNSSRSFEFAK